MKSMMTVAQFSYEVTQMRHLKIPPEQGEQSIDKLNLIVSSFTLPQFTPLPPWENNISAPWIAKDHYGVSELLQ